MNIKKIGLNICFIAGLLGMYYLGTKNYFENTIFSQKIHSIFTNIIKDFKKDSHEISNNSQESSNEVIEITDKDVLHDLIRDHKSPSIIFFHMNGCGFCKKMDPVYNEIVKNPRFSAIKFYSVNGRDLQAPAIVQELVDQKINGYPFFLFINENGYVDKHAGYKPQQDFEDKITSVFGDIVPADKNSKVRIQAMPSNESQKGKSSSEKGSSKEKGNSKHSEKSSKSHQTTPKIKELIKKFEEEVHKIPGDCKSSGKGHKEHQEKGSAKEKSPSEKVHIQAMPNKENEKSKPSSEKGASKEKGHEKKAEDEKKEKMKKIEHAYQAYKKLYDESKKMDNELIVSKEDNEKVKKAAVKLFDCRNIKNMVWRAWKVKPKGKPHVKEPGSKEKSNDKNKSSEKNK